MLQRLTGVTLLVFAIHGTALAQTGTITADVAGVVRSQTEAVIPAAQITLVNSSTNISRSVLSDARGRFTIPALPPGTYSLREELAGFDPYPAFRPSSSASPARRSRSTGAGSSGGRRGRRENVVLTIGSLIEINVTLAVAGHNEQIAVQAQPPPLDVGRIAVSSVVRGEQIENLPIKAERPAVS